METETSVSSAELYELFQNYVQLVDSMIVSYVGFLSGFIIMSYFAARRLNKTLTAIVITLYSLTCGILVIRLVLTRRSFDELVEFMFERQAAGLLELPFGSNPIWANELLSYLTWIVAVGGYLGSVLFFYQRRANQDDS